MTDIFSHFTKDSFRVLDSAKGLAHKYGQSAITSNHMLLGLLELPGSQAEEVLRQFPMKIDNLKTRLSAYIQLDAISPESIPAVGYHDRRYTLATDSTEVVQAAQQEARDQGVDFVDSRVLVLGMLRQPETSAGQLLQQFDVSLEGYRERAALQQVPPQDTTRASSTKRSLPSLTIPSPISPLFIMLVVFMVMAGYLTYAGIGDAGMTLFVFVLFGWIIAVALHEFGHAVTAYFSGDESMVDQGYLTLDPLKYTHPLLSIIFPLIFLVMGAIPLPGGAVYINKHAIRSRILVSLTSAAGPIATLTFGLLLAFPFITGVYESSVQAHPEFWAGLALLIFLQIFALVLNLLPIPGLDGFGILEPYMPTEILRIAYAIRPFSLILLFLLFVYSPFGQELGTQVWNAVAWINKDIAGLARVGLDLFFWWEN